MTDGENRYDILRFVDQPNGCGSRFRVARQKEVSESFKIAERLRRVDQPRQDLAFGFVALPPCTRALR